MMRRHALAALAVLAMGLVVSAPAEAGGTSGAVGVKKTANVKIKNNTTSPYYVLVVPDSLASSTKFGTIGTVGWAQKLGAVVVNPGATVVYPVPNGTGSIGILPPASVPASLTATLPLPTATGTYTVGKGKTVSKTINAGPVIN